MRCTGFSIPVARAAACAVLLGLSAVSHAASVRAVGTADLTARSDFVFHGRAIEKWVSAGQRPGAIVTNFRFQVFGVLKGKSGQQTVVLSFLGGTLNGRTLRVEGLRLPEVGEEGVYFVERLGGNLVQPFYGWDQGRFIVRGDAQGRKIVLTHDQLPVRRVDSANARTMIATGHAVGIETSGVEREAMTVEAFKSRIREIVAQQALPEAGT